MFQYCVDTELLSAWASSSEGSFAAIVPQSKSELGHLLLNWTFIFNYAFISPPPAAGAVVP